MCCLGAIRVRVKLIYVSHDDVRLFDRLFGPLFGDGTVTATFHLERRAEGATLYYPARQVSHHAPETMVGRTSAPTVRDLFHAVHVEMLRLLIADNERHLRFVGSALAVDSRLVWLAGTPSSGKSTLALELMRRYQWDYVSDEFVLWSFDRGDVAPLPVPLVLREIPPNRTTSSLAVPLQPPYLTSPVWFFLPSAPPPQDVGIDGGTIIECLHESTLSSAVEWTAKEAPELSACLQLSARCPLIDRVERVADEICGRIRGGARATFRDPRAAADAIARFVTTGSAEAPVEP